MFFRRKPESEEQQKNRQFSEDLGHRVRRMGWAVEPTSLFEKFLNPFSEECPGCGSYRFLVTDYQGHGLTDLRASHRSPNEGGTLEGFYCNCWTPGNQGYERNQETLSRIEVFERYLAGDPAAAIQRRLDYLLLIHLAARSARDRHAQAFATSAQKVDDLERKIKEAQASLEGLRVPPTEQVVH